MRKPAFCICENKDADQLRVNREADQRLCFRHTDSAIPLLSKPGISSLKLSSVAVQPGLCRTWSKTPKTGFLTMRLIYMLSWNTRWPLNAFREGVGDNGWHLLGESLNQTITIMKKCHFLLVNCNTINSWWQKAIIPAMVFRVSDQVRH